MINELCQSALKPLIDSYFWVVLLGSWCFLVVIYLTFYVVLAWQQNTSNNRVETAVHALKANVGSK